jgi:hypothetical protein
MAAAALAPKPVQHCQLCQASFVTEAQLQQHLDGPVHKKAVEKAAREAAKLQHINEHSAVAQEALAAAAWLGGRHTPAAAGGGGNAHSRPSQPPSQVGGRGQQQQQQQQNRRHNDARQPGRQGGAAGAFTEPQLTHEQVLAAAKQDSGPLSLDGT